MLIFNILTQKQHFVKYILGGGEGGNNERGAQSVVPLGPEATAVEEGARPAPSSPRGALCTGSYVGFKLTAMLTIGDEVPVGSKVVLQTVCLFAFCGFFLLLFLLFFLFILILTITSHIPDALDKENNGL